MTIQNITRTDVIEMNSHVLGPFEFLQKMDLLEQARLGLHQAAGILPGSRVFLPRVLSPQNRANLGPHMRPPEAGDEEEDNITRHSSPGAPMSGAGSPGSMELTESLDCRSPHTEACMSVDDDGVDADEDDDDISVGSPPSPPAQTSSPSTTATSPSSGVTPPLSLSQTLTSSPILSPATLIAPSPLSLIPTTSTSVTTMSLLQVNNKSNNSTTKQSSLLLQQHLLPASNHNPHNVSLLNQTIINGRNHLGMNNNFNHANNSNNNNCNDLRSLPSSLSLGNPNASTQSTQGSPHSTHPKVEPLDPDLCARSPPAAHQPPSPQNPPTQRQLKFSIDNILKPEFGSRRSEDGTNEPHQEPVDLSREMIPMSRMLSPGRATAPMRVATPLASDPGKLSSDTELWPAWVFCTRYSDRPSAGKIKQDLVTL